jgi:hypothetical protein
VHVRRALLLFAIVLGLAAIATSVSREPEEPADPPPPRSEVPSVSPGDAEPARDRAELVFDATRDQSRRVEAGSPASVLVEVDEPGLVEIPELGLSAPADALTPARFELLPRDPDRFEISFTPVEDDAPAPAGTLVVRSGVRQ